MGLLKFMSFCYFLRDIACACSTFELGIVYDCHRYIIDFEVWLKWIRGLMDIRVL